LHVGDVAEIGATELALPSAAAISATVWPRARHHGREFRAVTGELEGDRATNAGVAP